jgi:hypothetical protein
MKEISFKYMTKQKLAWQPLELTPEEYFELDPGDFYGKSKEKSKNISEKI